MAKKTPEEIALEKISYVANTRAKILDLSGLGLATLPDELWKLSHLEVLNIGFNSIAVVSDKISTLKNLIELYASNNRLSNLPLGINQLIKLRVMDLSGNQLTSFPSGFESWSGLVSLSFGETLDKGKESITQMIGNRLDTIPPNIALLKNLETLDVSNNNIKQVPSQIQGLIKLRVFNIFNNPISNLPSEIGRLTNLEELYISTRYTARSKISQLPKSFQQLTKLKQLALEDTDLPIPPEILKLTKQPQTILNYYFSHSQRPLNQIKLIIVGQGSVGKTSLIRQILYREFNPKEMKTDGIAISQWSVRNSRNEIKNSNSQIGLNIWDFGGQEIMHATHQFFLTKRSLYLLVLDSRLTQEENRAEYWLKIIQSFGGESPVLIVGNKIDQHPLDIDRTGLQKKYPNIVGILETSAAAGTGIEELKAAITEQVNNLPHVRDLLPETWFTVKTKLEGLGRESNFITHDKYLDLCAENEVSDETSQRTLIGFLHDLGVVLHFQDDLRLEALGILNPQWVTNGVYKILNSHTLFQNKGVLTVTMLDEILNLPEYPRGKRLFIVDMMKKFELCYDIEPDKTFLVPDLLPKDQPDLQFNGVPAFEYAYPVLPSSVITRFIVRMNQKIDDGFVWRTGAVLKIGENKALVKADIEDRKITIAIDGLEHTRRDTLSAIRFQLDEIHASIKGLNPEKRVPIPEAPNAETVEYEYLLMLEREGQETYLAKDGSRLVKVNIREILSGIESEAQRKETGGNVTNIYIGGDVKGSTIISGDNNVVFSQKIQESVKKAETSSIPPELMETLKLLGEAVDVMNKVLPKEQAADTTEDFGKLVDEATRPAPQKKWYSVSIEGLIKAAENVEKVGVPVINLSRKVLSLLTGGVVR